MRFAGELWLVAEIAACGIGHRIWVIDQLEGGHAVLVDPRGAVRTNAKPGGAAEGDVLVGGVLDPAERLRRIEEIGAIRERLSQGDDRADFSLASGEP
jgi:hypothetical protein